MELQSYMWLQDAEQGITNTLKEQLLSLKAQLLASNPYTRGPREPLKFLERGTRKQTQAAKALLWKDWRQISTTEL